MKAQSSGFTLIELVCCVLLLGIVSATVGSRYTDVRDRTLEATFMTVRGDFKYAILFVHAMGQIEQVESGGVPATLSIGTATVTMNVASGYPRRNQPAANCAGLAVLEPGLDEHMNGATYIVFKSVPRLLGISTVLAGGGGGGGGNPCTLLELLLLGEDFDDWTQSFSPNTVTFTDPNGRTISYNHTTGNVL